MRVCSLEAVKGSQAEVTSCLSWDPFLMGSSHVSALVRCLVLRGGIEGRNLGKGQQSRTEHGGNSWEWAPKRKTMRGTAGMLLLLQHICGRHFPVCCLLNLLSGLWQIKHRFQIFDPSIIIASILPSAPWGIATLQCTVICLAAHQIPCSHWL